jgi:hypothetical protein
MTVTPLMVQRFRIAWNDPRPGARINVLSDGTCTTDNIANDDSRRVCTLIRSSIPEPPLDFSEAEELLGIGVSMRGG